MPDDLTRLSAALRGRYAVERLLGAGGMARVYLARDPKHERTVALKVLRPEIAQAVGPHRFLDEIRVTANLQHPHILPLYDSGSTGEPPDGLLYYVMPYVDGESLRERLDREKQLPIDDAVAIAAQVALALAHAHSHGIVHRDIKPENILLSGGVAVVADFGIARAVSRTGEQRLTATGLAVGTPLYMSPEQASGASDVDGRADVYSLGCVLYEMLAGRPPFVGPTAESVVSQHVAAPPPDLSALRPAIPSPVADLVARSLAKTPADRFVTAHEFAEALRATARATEAARPRHASWRRFRWMGMAAVVTGALVVWLLVRGDTGSSGAAGTIRATVAVLPFAPAVPDSGLQRLGQELAITVAANLDQVGEVRAVDPMTVLARMPERAVLPASEAVELGAALGARAVLHGATVRLGDAVRVEAALLSAADGTVLERLVVTAGTSDIAALTDSVTWSVLRTLWEVGTPPTPSLSAVTTASIPALRAYLDGERAIAEDRFPEAIEHLHRAFALDTTFWLAAARYRFATRWWGVPADSTIARGAWEHRAELPERDRLLVEASASGSTREGLDLLAQAARRYPGYWPAWLAYQDALVHAGGYLGYSWADSREALEHLLSLNPDLTPALTHRAWIAAFERDSAALRELLPRLEAAARFQREGESAVSDLGLYEALEQIVRHGALTDEQIARSAPMVAEIPAPDPEAYAGGQLVIYQFPAAQIELARAMRAVAPSPGVAAAQWWAVALGWSARGQWDSAMVAMRRYAEQVGESEALLLEYGMATLGAWLGAVDVGSIRFARDRMRPFLGELDRDDRADAAWLGGILAVIEDDADGLERARSEVQRLDTQWSPLLDGSLEAFGYALRGEMAQAADRMRRVEETAADSCCIQRPGGAHPFLPGIDRLALARWLVRAGEPREASRLLHWHEAVFPSGYWKIAHVNHMLGSVAAFEQARAEEALGRLAAARRLYERFLSLYDRPNERHAWMVEEARSALVRLRDPPDVAAP